MNPHNFFAELKRRNVYKVAVAYAVVGWLLVQVATQVFPFFEIPNWAVRLVVLLIIIGFPIALIIAWAFELTPEGIKQTEYVEPSNARSGEVLAAGRASKNRNWIYVTVIGAALSVALFFLGRHSAPNSGCLRLACPKNRSRCCLLKIRTATQIPITSVMASLKASSTASPSYQSSR